MKRLIRSLLAIGAILTVLAAAPAYSQSKRIYIALDDHTDYQYTLTEEENQQNFLDSIDYYLDLADATAGLPSNHQSRWNCDGSYWLWTYERRRSAAEFARLITRLRDGHISAPLTPLVLTYGGQPSEAVLRSMYYAGSLERRYNLRFPLAVAMENATLPFGLGSLWAGAGAKYSWRGICSCATRTPTPTTKPDIYWWQGLDKSRILMKWNQFYPYSGSSIGNYFEGRYPDQAVLTTETSADFKINWPYDVIGIFGYGGDDGKTLTDLFVNFAQNNSTPDRQIIVSNEADFFQDFEANYGATLPTLSTSFGNEWDLLCASMAEVTSSVKRSVEKLRSAEAIETLVSLKNPLFYRDKLADRNQAWINFGLYWEHAWTADGYIKDQRPAYQRRIAGQINGFVDQLAVDSAAALGALIPNSSANKRYYAFNPVSWTRTDFADFPVTTADPVYAVDISTGLEAPSQYVIVNGQTFLRVLASDVPPVGYKVFEIRPGVGGKYSDAASATGDVIENPFYRITVGHNGAITSLIDKTRGNREFARQINGRYINDLGPGDGQVEIENRGPVSVTIKVTTSASLNHVTRITLFRNSDRIDFRNEINQNFSDVYTWGYGFNLDNPDTHHEEVGAVIRARTLDQGGQYALDGARHDWLTLNHFADMTGTGQVGVTLSNADCLFMRLGNSDVINLDTNTPQISPLAGGQVDGTHLGIPHQAGDSYFLQRFALRTHADYDGPAAMRFALEHQNPFVTHQITGGAGYPESNFSLLAISDPSVALWSIKPSEEGISEGVIARTYNLNAQAANASLQLANSISSASRTTHIETDTGAATLTGGILQMSLEAQQYQTHRLFTSSEISNTPPVAGIIGPTNGATFSSSAKVVINAVAADAGGSVNKVEFYDGSNKLGETTLAPYSLTVDSMPIGAHSITVQATDNSGAVAMSTAVLINVIAFPASSSSTSTASYRPVFLAPGSIASAFGASLASTIQAAAGTPLPTTLGDTQITIVDSLGRQYLSQLFYVSPNQVNYYVPDEVAAGTATVTIASAGRSPSQELVQISPAVPGLFSARADGEGLAAATTTRISGNGTQTDGNVVVYDAAAKKFVAIPIDLGPVTDRVFLILYGTGLRQGLVNATVQIGGVDIPIDYVGPQGYFVGLDQVNILLPRSLAGRGEIPVNLNIFGQSANVVTVSVK